MPVSVADEKRAFQTSNTRSTGLTRLPRSMVEGMTWMRSYQSPPKAGKALPPLERATSTTGWVSCFPPGIWPLVWRASNGQVTRCRSDISGERGQDGGSCRLDPGRMVPGSTAMAYSTFLTA